MLINIGKFTSFREVQLLCIRFVHGLERHTKCNTTISSVMVKTFDIACLGDLGTDPVSWFLHSVYTIHCGLLGGKWTV